MESPKESAQERKEPGLESAARQRRKAKRDESEEADDDVPSEDFLKIIHQFTARFFHDRGQLTTHRLRREKRRAREAAGEDESVEDNARGKDFYKAFDRSALVAIGMLLEEQIRHDLARETASSETPSQSA